LPGGLAASASTATTAQIPRLYGGPNLPAPPPVGRQAPPTAGPSALTYSFNWSGYVATSSTTFKSVRSTFVQPAVTCPVSGAFTVFWVGLDGWTTGTVEQDGTAALCNGTTPIYFAWWEMYPTNTIQATMGVSPGDKIESSVSSNRGHFTLTVKDLTAKTSHTNVETCGSGLTCSQSSAEWIIERPGYGGNNFAPLADWGTTSLRGDKAALTGGTAQPISQFSNTGIDMINNSATKILATVGGLNPSGNSFPDTWNGAS
jgi:hypothetical protein